MRAETPGTQTRPLDFLVAATPPEALAAPPAAGESEVAGAVRAFMEREVLPRSEALESGDTSVLLDLFSRAAGIGLTGLDVPEEYGGLGLGLLGAMLASAEMARQASFSTSMGAHFGIGTLPLVLFGSQGLKERYLPTLARAERIGAYALTEPDAGSDALAVRTRARRTSAGDYALTGRKQFITNAGIAGLYTVFAKVDGEAFTAFLVPAETPGVAAGAPERKMGLRGSPTASVTFDDARVPEDHVLGEVGKGHHVAFNVLNVGRMKLAFGSLGCARETLRHAARHAAERRQFGRPIGELGLIRSKLAEMAAAIFVLEGVALRTAWAMDARLPNGLSSGKRAADVLKQHAVPSAMVKVIGSEAVGFVADEAVQVHGGYGFSEEYPVCRTYRDVRVNRIFEGTNEVSRLLAAGGIVKGGMSGQFDIGALLERGRGDAPGAAPGAAALCEDLRWALGRLLDAAVERFGLALESEQLVLAGLADLAMELYGLDTAAARVAADGGLGASLIELAGETARARLLAGVVPLAVRLGRDPGPIVAAFAAGARDASASRDAVAAAVLERGGL